MSLAIIYILTHVMYCNPTPHLHKTLDIHYTMYY